MVTNWLALFMGCIFGIVIVWIICMVIIVKYKLPTHRLIRYRILREHRTFDCVGKVYGYYKFYIQETHFIFWSEVDDKDIPVRDDGELDNNKKQRHDNYFDNLENALKCKEDLIKKREYNYEIRKAKEEDKIFK